MKKIAIITLLCTLHCSLFTVSAQPRYDFAKLKHERLDRGVVAIRQEGKVIVSWRTLTSDKPGEATTRSKIVWSRTHFAKKTAIEL